MTADTFDQAGVRGLSLFDANCRLGPSNLTTSGSPVSVIQLLAEMDRCGIEEALVFHAIAEGYSPVMGNKLLIDQISRQPRLHPCWVILPPQTGEIEDPRSLVGQMSATGVKAARMFPVRHRFSLSLRNLKGLLGELSRHRIPVFFDFDRRHWAEDVVDYEALCRICEEFADLPVVLVREGIGSTRHLYPMLEKFTNFHIEISYYQPPGGLLDIARRFGAHHLLFGTGLPTYSAGPPLSMVFFSEVSMEEKRMIAGGNLHALLTTAGLNKIGGNL